MFNLSNGLFTVSAMPDHEKKNPKGGGEEEERSSS